MKVVRLGWIYNENVKAKDFFKFIVSQKSRLLDDIYSLKIWRESTQNFDFLTIVYYNTERMI